MSARRGDVKTASGPGVGMVVLLIGGALFLLLAAGLALRLRIRRASAGTAPRDDDVLFQGADPFTSAGDRGGLTYHRRQQTRAGSEPGRI